MDPVTRLGSLNANPNLDISNSINTFNANLNNFLNEHDADPFDGYDINSVFYDEPTFTDKLKNSKNPLILNLNIQGLNSKFDKLSELTDVLEQKNVLVDIIAIQETWEINNVDLISLSNFQRFVFKSRTSARGGGVGFYVRKGLKFRILEELSIFNERTFESLCIEVEFENGKKVLLTSLYRPPSSTLLTNAQQFEVFMECFENLLSLLTRTNTVSYILTDSNLDLLKLNENMQSLNYFQTLTSHGFINIINKATRFSTNSASLIDHILTNTRHQAIVSGVLIQDISDHCITFCLINTSKNPSSTGIKTARSYSNTNLLNFRECLSSLGWTEVLECNDPVASFNIFWDIFSTFFNLNFPLNTVPFNKNVHKINNFMTQGLLVSRLKKVELYKVYLASRTIDNFTSYKNYRNRYNSLLRLSKKMYFETELEKKQKDSRATWKILNESINKQSAKSNEIKEITVNGQRLTDPTVMANEFNTYFSNIANVIRAKIPESSVRPESFAPPCEHEFLLEMCSPDQVNNIIQSLETKTSLDIDGLNTKVLKKVSDLVSHPLSHIINLSFQQGIVPPKLKVSRTVPIFKSGLADNCSNYRPISCLPVLSKIFEKIVTNQLYSYLVANNILYNYQFGFQPGKSTLHPLIHICDYISKAFNSDEIVVGVFLDLQKAFDLVDHNILLKKLECIGVKGIALKWFENYLKDRKQFVMVNGELSEFCATFNVSVPQGSNLGPLLFLIFINDMHRSNDLNNFHFADDTTGLMKGKNIHELVASVNRELNQNWGLALVT